MWPARALAGLLALAALATPAGGQAPAIPLLDSLAAEHDPAALQALERQLIAWARRNRDDPDVHLRLGAVALRLGELVGQPHWDHAVSEFEWAAELDPRSPLPWHGLGLAWLGMTPAQYDTRTTVQAMLGFDPVARAGEAFRAALDRAPGYAPSARAWGSLALLPALRDEAPAALEALRAVPAGRDTALDLVRGRLERRRGHPDSALAAFARYERAGGSPGLARLERARVLLAAGLPGGAEAYYEGAALADPAAAALYRADLAFVVEDSALAGFDAATGSGRRAWLEQFWRQRDLESLRKDDERLAEHYRRLETAQADFGLAPFKRRFGFGDYYQSGRTDVDDRGVIYIRHGLPTDRNRTVRFQAESWYYAPGTAQELWFHFVALDDLTDYRLVPSAAQVPLAAHEDLRDQGGPASDEYWRIATIGSAARQRVLDGFFARGRELMVIGTTTDSWGRRWERPLQAAAQAVATGLRGGPGQVHVALAVPLRRLPADSAGTRRLSVRLVALAPDGTPAARVDSVVEFTPAAGVRTGLVRISFAAPPGRLRVQAIAEAADSSGAVVLRDSLDVPDAEAGLGLSDIVLGRESLGLSWPAGDGEAVALNPIGTFPRGEPLSLYYEIYGLGEDLAVTELVLWRPEDGDTAGAPPPGATRGVLRLRYEERGTGWITRARRTVDLGELPPGRYRLRLIVRDGDGREAARTARLVVTRN